MTFPLTMWMLFQPILLLPQHHPSSSVLPPLPRMQSNPHPPRFLLPGHPSSPLLSLVLCCWLPSLRSTLAGMMPHLSFPWTSSWRMISSTPPTIAMPAWPWPTRAFLLVDFKANGRTQPHCTMGFSITFKEIEQFLFSELYCDFNFHWKLLKPFFYMIDNSQSLCQIFFDQIWPIFAEIFAKNMKGSPGNSEILCVNQIDRDLKKSRKQQFYLRTPSRCKYLPNIFCHNIFQKIFGARLTWQNSPCPLNFICIALQCIDGVVVIWSDFCGCETVALSWVKI